MGRSIVRVAIRRGLGASGKPFGAPAGAYPCPRRGLTRRLRRGRRACSPMGRSHFSFGGERKVCKRKPAARRLREKALYCPFLKEGVRNVARSTVGLPTFTFVRARAHSNPLSKRARLFPSAAYRRSAPPQSAWGILTPCWLECFGVAWVFLQRKRPARSQNHAGRFCEPRGLSPSGGSFAVKLHVPRAPCAPAARSPGSRGTTP